MIKYKKTKIAQVQKQVVNMGLGYLYMVKQGYLHLFNSRLLSVEQLAGAR